MPEPIPLSTLKRDKFYKSQAYTDEVVMPALVDAVEAAQALMLAPWAPQPPVVQKEMLRQALSRFVGAAGDTAE